MNTDAKCFQPLVASGQGAGSKQDRRPHRLANRRWTYTAALFAGMLEEPQGRILLQPPSCWRGPLPLLPQRRRGRGRGGPYYCMPRAHEREWGVRMKGQIDGGNIAPDGLIPNWGRLRSGTLAVSTSGLFSV